MFKFKITRGRGQSLEGFFLRKAISRASARRADKPMFRRLRVGRQQVAQGQLGFLSVKG